VRNRWARDDNIWKKTMDELVKVGGSASLKVFEAALNALATAVMSP
jgi:hypothetical protein